MSDPQTANVGLYQPTRSSDTGVWDLPVNANMGATDSLFANVASISLSSVNVTLTTPPNAGSSWSGPYQSQSSLIKLTGSISANITITLPRAGFFIFWNLCTSGSVLAGTTSGSKYIRVGSGSPGNYIGLTPGKKMHVFCDGTDCDYVNAADPGTAYDLHGATAMPSWMTACTVLPYLIKDGTVYNNTTYPALASYLGTQFGGSGATFAVPDERARARYGLDTGSTFRLTNAGSGVTGTSMGSAGGDENYQSHSHTTNPHNHGVSGGTVGGSGSNAVQAGGSFNAASPASNISIGNSTVIVNGSGSGDSGNLPPAIVSFLPLIKT